MLTLKNVMTKHVIYVKRGAPIYKAMNLLLKHKISGMPVVAESMRVVGVLSEKDVLRLLVDRKLDINSSVDDYMTREVICFSEEDSAFDLCKFFIKSNIRRVPIVKKGKLVGIVSRHDIVNLILEVKTKFTDFRYT